MEESQHVDPSTAAVTEMLSTSINPLVAVTILPEAVYTRGQVELKRGIGFVTQRFRSNLRLVTTCRHAFVNYSKPDNYILTIKNPLPTQLRMVADPIYDTNPENDIAFVIVRDPQNARTRPLVIQADDIPLPEQRNLYNAGNRTDLMLSSCEFFVARQPVIERREWAFAKFTDPVITHVPMANEAEQESLKRDGWIRCRSLNMVSRQGFSGSPIWDDELRLYGMDVRGSEPGTEYHNDHGDVTICVPTSEIYLARQRVDSQIQAVLNSI